MAGWLRPGGRLVSMQPIGRPMPFHVRRAGRIEPVGVVYATDAGQRDMRASRQALAESIRAGLFTPRAELSVVLEFHYRTEKDWHEFLERPRIGAVEADPGMELAVDVDGRTLRAGSRQWPLGIPEAVRDGLVAGTWDAIGELVRDPAEVRRVHDGLPYIRGFGGG